MSQYTLFMVNHSFSSTLMNHSIQRCGCSTNVRTSILVCCEPCEPNLLSPKDPYILPMVKVDRGAIRFLLAGAHMMCPGFTSPGGYLPPAPAALPAGTPVAIHAEGKEHALGIGITKLGTEEMRKVNKGVGVEIATHLGDDLWALQKL